MTPGEIYVVEHKTSSLDIGAGTPYWRRLTLDSQVSNYLRGAKSTGLDARGVLYDVVRKVGLQPYAATPEEQRKYTAPKDKACPECKKKNPTPAPHMVNASGKDEPERLVACVDGRVVTDPGGKLYANLRDRDETIDEYRERVRTDIGNNPEKYYQRGVVVRLPEEERDAAFDTWNVGREIRESQLAQRWPRNPDACDAYNSLCAYFDVCTGAASIDDPTRFAFKESTHTELDEPSEAELEARRRLPILSTSSARAYRSCPRKYFYAYEQRKRLITDKHALRFGTLFHIGLEAWWRGEGIANAIAAMRAAYAKLEADPIDAVRAEELLLGYHVKWRNEPLDVLAVERQFHAPLTNPQTGHASKTWQLGGKIDAIVRVAEVADVHQDTVPAPGEEQGAA